MQPLDQQRLLATAYSPVASGHLLQQENPACFRFIFRSRVRRNMRPPAREEGRITIKQRRLNFLGNVVRMSNHTVPHIALNGYVHGMRSRGRPKKRWFDTIREDCDEMTVDLGLHTATHMAHDQRQWRESVNELLTRVDETLPRQKVK